MSETLQGIDPKGQRFPVYPVGGGWFRHPVGKAVRYTWGVPDDLAGSTLMSVTATHDGLCVANNLVPLRTEDDLEGLLRILLIAHRQYTERLSIDVGAHAVEEDRDLYAWFGEQ